MSLPERDLRNITPMDFCSIECTYRYGIMYFSCINISSLVGGRVCIDHAVHVDPTVKSLKMITIYGRNILQFVSYI